MPAPAKKKKTRWPRTASEIRGLVGRTLVLEARDLDGSRSDDDLSRTAWTVDGVTTTGETFTWTPRSVGIHTVRGQIPGRAPFRLRATVGLVPSELRKLGDAMDFYLCLVVRAGPRTHFVPLFRNERLPDEPGKLSKEVASHHPAFARFLERQASVFSRNVLPQLPLATESFAAGLYAVFPSATAYLGDAPALARAGRQVGDGIDAICARSVGRGSGLRELEAGLRNVGSSLQLSDQAWYPARGKVADQLLTQTVSQVIGAAQDYLSDVGLHRGAQAIVTLNGATAGLTTRLFDGEAGFARQATTLIGFDSAIGNCARRSNIPYAWLDGRSAPPLVSSRGQDFMDNNAVEGAGGPGGAWNGKPAGTAGNETYTIPRPSGGGIIVRREEGGHWEASFIVQWGGKTAPAQDRPYTQSFKTVDGQPGEYRHSPSGDGGSWDTWTYTHQDGSSEEYRERRDADGNVTYTDHTRVGADDSVDSHTEILNRDGSKTVTDSHGEKNGSGTKTTTTTHQDGSKTVATTTTSEDGTETTETRTYDRDGNETTDDGQPKDDEPDTPDNGDAGRPNPDDDSGADDVPRRGPGSLKRRRVVTLQDLAHAVFTRGGGYTDPPREPAEQGGSGPPRPVLPGGGHTDPSPEADADGFGTWGGFNPPIDGAIDPIWNPIAGEAEADPLLRTVGAHRAVRIEVFSGPVPAGIRTDGLMAAVLAGSGSD